MKIRLRLLWMIFGFSLLHGLAISQGLPPGWSYVSTPSNHIVSIPLTCNPNINGVSLSPGDYIGVFYVNDLGAFSCGGAVEWTGVANTGLIAFGDDSFTSEKDGFASNEIMHYKVYSWNVQKEFSATVTCNSALPNSCTNFISNGLSGLSSLNATGFFVTISANPLTICSGSSSQLNSTISGGGGNYTYAWTSNPPGFTSNIQNPVVNPLVTTQYFVTVTSGANNVSGSITVAVVQKPVSNAGSNMSICENLNPQLNGTASNQSSVNWSTSGDGTFSNAGLLNPVYFLGQNDKINGSVTLTLTASAIAPCTLPVSSSLIVNIYGLAQANAGNDFTVCESSAVQLSASAANYFSVSWSSNGDGTFSNSSILNPVYTPGTNDKLNGSVQLTISVSAVLPCTNAATDVILIGIQHLPQVNAGIDQTVCEGQNFNLAGVASAYSQILWTTAGDGIFVNPAALSTIYVPGTNDIAAGVVSITLTANSISPCSPMVSDQLALNIVHLASVFAGNDATICETGIHQISGTASNYDEVLWTTTGDGVFGNPSVLSTTYSPGIDDIANGNVILLLTAFPTFPCTISAQDEKILNIVKIPQVNAGGDELICEDSNITLNGVANNYLIIQWVTDGDGTFSNLAVFDPVYSPGINDIASGTVHLTLTALPESPCSTMQQDMLLLEINKMPTANAGTDITIKSDEICQLNGFAQYFSTVGWSTSGDGVFDDANILNPIYTPGLNDIAIAGAELSLTSFAIFPCAQDATDNLVLTIDTITSVKEIGNSSKFRIFPNPNSGEFAIEGLNIFDNPFQIKILTMKGIIIYDKPFVQITHSDNAPFFINISGLKNGVYLLKAFNNKHFVERKIVVLR